MNPPFSYIGSKSKIAKTIWNYLGDVAVYVEPFGGSLATLLARPDSHKIRREVVGELDGYIAHFWRAIKNDPAGVARYADYPNSELELRSRSAWFIENRQSITTQLMNDPDWFDVKIAGWWVWGHNLQTQGFANANYPNVAATLWCPRERGGYRSLPPKELVKYFRQIALRLRNVTIVCDDWRRTIGKAGIKSYGKTAILLDPPYTHKANRTEKLYAVDSLTVGFEVARWAQIRGDDLRICLCGYEVDGKPEYDLPGWHKVAWRSQGGKGNSDKERLWFSPACMTSKSKRRFTAVNQSHCISFSS